MKTLNFFAFFLFGIANAAMSQTLTGTFTQAPCNDDGIYSVNATGLQLPITFTYYVNGAIYVHPNVNSTSDQLTNISMSNNGSLFCEATSAGLYAYSQGSYTPSFTFTSTASSPTCPATVGLLSAVQQGGTTGPFSYSWINQFDLSTFSGNNVSVPVGEYFGYITDQTTGCVLISNDSSLVVEQLSNVTANLSYTTANCTNGSATATGTGGISPYTYVWSNGATSSAISGLSTGVYTVDVTDAQGCVSTNLQVFVPQSPNISVNITPTNATCLQNDGSAIAFGAGGSGPYTYTWSNGQTGNTASNLVGNQYYTVLATDANGCLGTGSIYTVSSTPINVTSNSTPSSCTSATGSITLSVSGGQAPYTYNWIGIPSANSSLLSNISSGLYQFQVTDANGCVQSGSVFVNPISTINANFQSAAVVCPATTGNANVSVFGTNAPFTYLWNNGATTNQITGVALGGYSCVITDAVGCSVTKSGSITSISPVHIGLSTTAATCAYNSDGSAVSTVFGGQSPYTYQYSNGSTTASASSLNVGTYTLTVTDANGCSSNKYFGISNANTSTNCFCTISGTVYQDANSNCSQDSGENGIENIMVHCSGFGYAFTDVTGYYSFQVPTGTYVISEVVNSYYPLSVCQNNTNSVTVVANSGCVNEVNFSNSINPIHDLKVVTMNSTIPPIPGNNYQQKVVVKNLGTVAESNIQMGYSHDDQLVFSSASLPSFMQLNSGSFPYAYNVETGFPNLNPNQSTVILLDLQTPTNIPLGTNLAFNDTVTDIAPIETNWLLDYTPWNNVNTFQTTVIGSYDPNYKEVLPKGTGSAGYVSSATKEFDYTIHFQNEGTYFAQNIVVTDQLDSDLDWTTFRPGYSDHQYTATLSETGLVTFTFANIQLAWKDQYGDALSSGLVNYSIERKATNPEGTVFTNSAAIYFDYNAPIITNTTMNTLDNSLAGVVEQTIDATEEITMELFPVPAQDQLTVRVNNVIKGESATLQIIDLMGHIVLTQNVNLTAGSTQLNQNVSSLQTGTYFTRIHFENGTTLLKKMVVFKN